MHPSLLSRVRVLWTTSPWLQRLVLYAIPMLFCVVDRLVALSAILDLFAADNERDLSHILGGLVLGLVEDALMTTVLVVFLFVLELTRRRFSTLVKTKVTSLKTQRRLCGFGHTVRAIVVFVGIVATLAFVAADLMLVETRAMRFTTDLIAAYVREQDKATSLEVDPRELRVARATIVSVALVSLGFTWFYLACVDLLSQRPGGYQFTLVRATSPIDLEKGSSFSVSSRRDSPDPIELKRSSPVKNVRPVVVVVVAYVSYVALIAMTQSIAMAASPVVAAIALNATLNELVRNLFHIQFQHGSGGGTIESAAYYLDTETETYHLFADDVLYRKTLGFKGPLAFDVQVDEKNPPNVLVIGVESFRYMDSLLMSANTSAGELMQKNNLTVTPQFDRWAKRGIAFPNMWSSWQTSRSLEAILFGQVPYDSVTDSGTTRGRKDTKLVGMPQFFKQKGYETVFTTGCTVEYDQWDVFLPSHGFETLMAAPSMKVYAEQHYNISHDDWDGPAQRGFNWGVHDDVSFEIIGDLLLNKTKAQAERIQRGEPKQPFFMNHYTISSHHTFDPHPTWLDSENLPDFSPLCEGWEGECTLIKKYAKLRYFTDMELGKFLDRMKKEGVLEDTIVVIVGDHGQSPEFGLPMPYVYQTAVTHVASAMIAERRLGKYTGMVFEDATHHYDLLNTLADIVGVPPEGFLQSGVGRSLKRQIPFGERLVWSNNPMKKMSVVRGHERFVYDRTTNGMGLYDTIHDPLEKHDLLPSLDMTDVTQLRVQRRKGRELNAYFKHRWDHKCIAKVSC